MTIVAEATLSTLRRYADGRLRQADHGQPGSIRQRDGAAGEDLSLHVPVGTIVRDLEDASDGEPLADLSVAGASVVVARGGRGGWGNRRFANSVRQAPRFAQRGAEGQRRRLHVELKLLADIGLIGLPNAGKSTLLRAWTAAHPKVASYPFTTLEPELGVVEVGYETFVAADMPGLIEGASAGAGLGLEFLRHIERTRVLVHVIDLTRDDPLADRAQVDAELEAFGHGLADKPQLLALNKIDDPNARAQLELLVEEGEARLTEQLGAPWLAISAVARQETATLAERALWALREAIEAEQAAGQQAPPVLRPQPRRERFTVREIDGVLVVAGGAAERWASTLDLTNEEARQELFFRLRRIGVSRALERLGVAAGDRVRIGEQEVRWGG